MKVSAEEKSYLCSMQGGNGNVIIYLEGPPKCILWLYLGVSSQDYYFCFVWYLAAVTESGAYWQMWTR